MCKYATKKPLKMSRFLRLFFLIGKTREIYGDEGIKGRGREVFCRKKKNKRWLNEQLY